MRVSPGSLSRHHFLLALALAMAVAGALLASGCGGLSGTAAPGTAGATTAGGPPDNASYVFAVMGDSHTDGLDNGVLAAATRSAIANGAGFIVHTGDVTNVGAREEFERYAGFTASAGIPFYTIPGNHDLVTTGDTGLFESVVGPACQSFDHAGDHFILVDDSDEELGIDSDCMAWFRNELQANSGKPRQFIFTHIPPGDPVISLAGITGDAGHASRQEMAEEALSYGNVAGFFSGHLHGFIAYRIGDRDAWVSGGAGAEPYPSGAIGYFHYLLVSVDSGQVRVEVVRIQEQ